MFILIFSIVILCSLNAKESISLSETKNLIKKQPVYIIGLNEKIKWLKHSVKVKNYQSINRGVLEYKHTKIDFNQYKKDTIFIIFSKNSLDSMKFVKNLKKLGFLNVKYLEGGESTCKELITNFRGIKLFSMFIK